MAKRRAQEDRDSEREAQAQVYLERTKFFLKRADELGLDAEIQYLGSADFRRSFRSLDWQPSELAISPRAWGRARGLADLAVYFCHPRLITERPSLLLYYRSAALLSQKGAGYLVTQPERYENSRATPSPEVAASLARLLNQHLSELLEERALTPSEMANLAYISLGAQIQGSWNNAVGNGAAQNVKRLLIARWHADGVIARLKKKRTKKPQAPGSWDEIVESIPDFYEVDFSNGSSAAFASEPDVSLRNPRGTLACAIEIKGGTDPAGALERLGAAEKSFRAARDDSPRSPCKTILLMAAVTSEVSKRIASETDLVNSTYDLAEIYVNETSLEAFRGEVDEALWL